MEAETVTGVEKHARWEAFTSDELSAMTAWATAGGVAALREDGTEFGRFAARLYQEMQSEIDKRIRAKGGDPRW